MELPPPLPSPLKKPGEGYIIAVNIFVLKTTLVKNNGVNKLLPT